MPAFDKRSPGQKFNPHHEEWNAFIDAARGVKAAQQAVKDGPSLHSPSRLSTAKVRNVSGVALDRGDAVALRAPFITPTANEPEFLRQLTFDAYIPEASDLDESPQRIGVLLVPLGIGLTGDETNGAIGDCGVCGLVQCRVDIQTEGDRFASLTEDEAVLTSDSAGGAAVIEWAEGGTGEQWAVVRLAGGSGTNPGGVGSGNDVNFPRSDTNCRWYTSHAKFTEDTTATDLTGYLWFIPFQAPAGGSPAQIGVATTEGAQGAHLRLGIYAAQSSGIGEIAPGALIYDSGDKVAEGVGLISADLAEAEVELTPGGLYWLAVACDDDAVVLEALFVGDIHATLGLDETLKHSSRGGPCRVVLDEYGDLPEDLSAADQEFQLPTSNWPWPIIGINYGGCEDEAGGLVLDGGDGADSADEAVLGSPGNPDGDGICESPYIAVLGAQNTPMMGPITQSVWAFTPETTGTYYIRGYQVMNPAVGQASLFPASCPGETAVGFSLTVTASPDCDSMAMTGGVSYFFVWQNDDVDDSIFIGFEIGLGTCP